MLLAAAGLVGCNSPADVTPDAPPPAPPPPPARLGDHTDVNLADWLGKPRSELAQQVAEWSDTVKQQRQHAAENPLSLDLLPESAAAGDDAGVRPGGLLGKGRLQPAALRQGRRAGRRRRAPPCPARRPHAALKLADPTDKDLLVRIDGRRTDRKYPLEWTQLTALAFQSAEWKLATGEPQGAADLVQMHKQLRALLDDKAAAGPLGAALLPLGRRALAEAAAAWKKSKIDKQDLAEDVEAALKDWGESPPPAPALAPGASEFEAVRLFGRPAAGQAVVADNPEAVRSRARPAGTARAGGRASRPSSPSSTPTAG